MVSVVALPLTAILALGASPLQVGLLVAAETLPILLLGVPVGAYVDRHRRRRVMVGCDLLRASLVLSIPVAWWGDLLTIYQLYAVAFLVGSATVLFDVAYQSYVPNIVEADQLPTAYRGLEAANAMARLAGPGIGGALVQALSAPVALVADGFSYLLSYAFLQARKPVEEEPGATEAESRTAWSMAFAGFAYVLRSTVLRSVALFAAVGMFASAMMTAVEMIFLVRTLGQPPAVAGLFVTAGAAGALLAVAVSGRIRRQLGPDRMLRVPVMVCWPLAFLLPLATPGTAWLYACGSFFMAAGGVLANIEQNTLRPLITPPDLRGRVNAAMRILMWGAMPLGGLVGGALAEAFGVRACLVVVAVLMQLAVVPLLTRGMRRPYSRAHAYGPSSRCADSDQPDPATQEEAGAERSP
jgi:MFS family permease